MKCPKCERENREGTEFREISDTRGWKEGTLQAYCLRTAKRPLRTYTSHELTNSYFHYTFSQKVTFHWNVM